MYEVFKIYIKMLLLKFTNKTRLKYVSRNNTSKLEIVIMQYVLHVKWLLFAVFIGVK